MFGIETKVHQRVVALAGFHDHVAAFATIAARRTAARDELLPTKGHAAVAAVSRLYLYFRLIDEHAVYHEGHERTRRKNKKPQPEGEACDAGAARTADLPTAQTLLDFHGLDHDKLAHRTLVQELDAPGDLSEESVVFAAADIQPGLHPRATLPNNDGAAGHDLPAECLKPKPLRVRIAAIA